MQKFHSILVLCASCLTFILVWTTVHQESGSVQKYFFNQGAGEELNFLVPVRLADARFQVTYADPWQYRGPQVVGWPPGKDRNMSTYIREKDIFNTPIKACSKRLRRTRLLVLVKSAPSYGDRRRVNRETWVQGEQHQDDIVVLNMFGLAKKEKEQMDVVKENTRHCDMVQVNIVDDYQNLTLKVVSMLKYAVDNLPLFQPDFVFLMDDDSYLNIPELYDSLFQRRELTKFDYEIRGFTWDGTILRPGANDKEFVLPLVTPTYIFDQEKYPKHLSGGGYLLPRAVLPCLLQESMRMPLFHIDDVFISGMAAERCGYPRIKDGRFHALHVEEKHWKKTDLLLHYMSPEEKRKLVKFFNNTR